MAHPDWALKYRTKATELRNIEGRYYLYKITSQYDKIKKVNKKITLGMIGRITEKDGLIPKGTKKKVAEQPSPTPTPTVKEYGATHFLQSIGKDILQHLQDVFPDTWREIAVLSMNRLLYQSPLKNNEFLYHESFLTEKFKDLKLDKNTLTQFMQDLGISRDKIVVFMEKFVKGKENIVFDGTHVFSGSEQMKMNGVGYNSQKDFDPQINLMYMFSVDKQEPVYYRVFQGNVSGMKALKLSIKESGVEKCTVIGDKGFSSEANFASLEQEGLSYIFPLKRDSSIIDYEPLKSREYAKAFKGQFLYQNRPIFYYQLPEQDGRQVTVFHDPKLKLDEESTYLRRVAQGVEGYTMDTYQYKQLRFGTMSMIINLRDGLAADIYIQYKHRMEIETLFDSYKNLLEGDRSYMHSDAAFEAWAFLSHLATMLYYKIFALLKEHQMLGNLSPKDLLLNLTRVTKVKIRDQWHSAEINSKSLKLFHSLDISVT